TVAIDIGTTKICVLIARCQENSIVEILGIGTSPSYGLKKGVVVDIAKTVQSIKLAVQEASLMAGRTVESAVIGISGGHIQSFNSQGMVPIKHGEIRATDITQAINAAKAIVIPEGQQLLHVLPRYFMIDSRERVINPLGMHGVRLEAYIHLITGSIASVQNLIKCCEMAGVRVADIVLEQLASAQAVLSPDERELGVAMLDIGGGTSDLAVYQQGSIVHTMVLPVAGNHITNDIAIGLHTTFSQAEHIKKEYGLSSLSLLEKDQCFELLCADGISKQVLFQHELVQIIEARVTELLSLVKKEIDTNYLMSRIPAGLVITGGGSLTRGIDHLATNIFLIPIRIGNPLGVTSFHSLISNPMYATGYGLLLQANKKKDTSIDHLSGPLLVRVFSRMKSWMADFF
ncbi:MAG TPA: cell division protein FtsA, partial [Candidatus Babeliaceae bacterium]|nr:cell division protein FtsA [Candidatus Babeliaceae bacterium]